ncbi:BCCT family transporter [Mixta tenebrionis]|uniref:BCCT family transporter n=1 Tax=Mixta tenebrionis TaxID=2562439 RepID=A0A506V6C4_9GAMM|nr:MULTISPECIES: BCCT family transporter [Mixta]QHM77998.1 Glycine betaine transporter OpuD [Mixta theicola]TPW40979.1 BCCT family transporter [Mixta tenebrionis]
MNGTDKTNNDKTVFYVSLIVVACVVAWGVMGASSFKNAGDTVFSFLTTKFAWFYILCMATFVLFSIWICCSKYGNIVLGKDGEKPAYSTLAWFAMLFSAGKGIGLLFYSVAEPLSHYAHPTGAVPGSPEAMAFALRKSFLHWGLQPWSGYCVMALGLAYIQFRKDKPGLISSVLIPLLGEKLAGGIIGKCVDILAIFATVAGVATSFGLGTYQISSGLNAVFGLEQTNTLLMLIVFSITAILLMSIVAGLDKGMKRISSANLCMSAAIMLFMFFVGPRIAIMNGLVEGVGNYISHYVFDSLSVGAFSEQEARWYGDWTIFYWAWWIAWAPFVGTFIARISRGRTIRQFVLGVLLAPTLAGISWFSIFGMSAMGLGLDQAIAATSVDVSRSIYIVLQHFPFSTAISVLVVALLITFFLSSADSATFVLGMFSSNGDLNPKTSRKVMWALIQAALALALMIAGGKSGLNMLKTASISVAFPFAFILLLSMASLVKGLREETRAARKESLAEKHPQKKISDQPVT